jgi:hypothetical protein
MKQHFLIKYVLTGIAQLWLLFSILYCLQIAFFLLTGKDGYFIKTKDLVWGSANIFRDGYPVPAKLTVQLPADTIVNWEHENTSGGLALTKGQLFRYAKADSILNDTAIKKQFYFSKWVAEPGFSEMQHTMNSSTEAPNEFAMFDSVTNPAKKDIAATVEKNYISDVTVVLKSKSAFKNFAFALHSIISALVTLLVSFNIVKLLHHINSGNNFLSPMYKKIYIIGVILIAAELIQLILGFLYSKWFSLVRLEKVSEITNLGGREFNVQFNPSTSFSTQAFLFGLSLIILASLLKYGAQLEKENALTI